jgi:hypothetical protein
MDDTDDLGWQTVRGRNRSGHRHKQFFFDIATSKNITKDNYGKFTTYFFTNFQDNYGAKAMFNAFHHYGSIMEVVIPTKRDKGGRRFVFARFDRVTD